MRLIRLTTSSDGTFSNNFNEDIIIKPYSKIGLKSASISLNNTLIELKGSDRQVTMQFKDGDPKIFNLEEAVYDSTNDDDLLSNLELGLNTAVGSGSTGGSQDDKAIGIEFQVNKSPSEKTQISYVVNPHSDPLFGDTTSYVLRANVDQDDSQGGGGIQNIIHGTNAENTATGKNFFCSKRRLAKGRGSWHVAIHKLSDLATQGGDISQAGFVMGLTKIKPKDTTTEIDIKLVDFAISVPALGERISVIERNVTKELGSIGVIECPDNGGLTNVNDNFEIERVGDKINFYLYRQSVTGRTILQQYSIPEGEENVDLYPFCYFRGAGAPAVADCEVAIQSCFWSLSAYDHTEEELQQKGGITQLPFTYGFSGGTFSPPHHSGNPTTTSQNFIEFNSVDLANFLGFRQRRVPTSGFTLFAGGLPDVDKILFTSPLKYNHSNDQSYLVIMDSIQLTSYDGQQQDGTGQGQRRSILQVLQNPQGALTQRVIYRSEVPDMIDISNKQPISLRTMRLRVLDDEYNPIDTFGNNVLVIHIQDKE